LRRFAGARPSRARLGARSRNPERSLRGNYGSEPIAHFMRRERRDALRGSPRSFGDERHVASG